ncbi:FAD-binding oxidoreductase [Legionella oakridgensis]|uniref:2-polyprenylphenol hydroxylase-related flavodoxin oxidoreductase n=2 Tax=Legionella oakridgensis TaxID=29423 RepID=W0BHD8_9GAMM|nr:FAD-binding oxidoreductase [Legionella oakridgensis]AHE68141.1 2-polyprenylphenol hydroxylase-related flavodoxin oxidoreductase [Legionella oakridgensis ATCC 33761 = DSM 21215]ETO92355.1 2-polyprenylphenol hydroxylase [Legionella oakridgensis RV-2-2007]KTD37270.1 ferredoxin reductase [Legionella oakridgensis]STY21110.1 xylene monooxygenase [Legionella longbeachae]
MPELIYNNQTCSIKDGESVLECLLRHNIDHPHSCRIGVCQACLIKTTESVMEPQWQEGLPDTLKAQGYFLACQAKPSVNLHLSAAETSECDQEAMITEITNLTYNVIKVKLFTENLNHWTPGQYLNFINSDAIGRSYSIANLPAKEGYIELHIKLQPQGAMSRWLREQATVDTLVHIRGPFGKCYYINLEKKSFDILLAGTGTGLAPLLAIAKDALSQHHPGKITLIHGGCIDEDIYYSEELETLAIFHQNFNYIPCVLKSNGRYPEANINQQLLKHLANTTHTQVYVCGPKETTNALKTKAFLAGVPSSGIHSDAFL